MRVRKLDADGDMTFGQGQANFWRNAPDGVAQCAVTRLRLQLGEWFLDTNDGTPWKTRVLGRNTEATRDPAIRARVAGTTGMKQILSYSSQLNRETRRWSAQITVETVYGTIKIEAPL